VAATTRMGAEGYTLGAGSPALRPRRRPSAGKPAPTLSGHVCRGMALITYNNILNP
jgi:hypothetical protein